MKVIHTVCAKKPDISGILNVARERKLLFIKNKQKVARERELYGLPLLAAKATWLYESHHITCRTDQGIFVASSF